MRAIVSHSVRAVGAVLTAAIIAVSGPGRPVRAGEDVTVLSLRDALARALARDVLVRDAEHALANARAQLDMIRARPPQLLLSWNTSAATTPGLDPESDISGTEYSSQGYGSSLNMPLTQGTNLSLSTSASTSTTNSVLRTGEGESFTYAGASVRLGVSRPVPLFRSERVLTEGSRWSAGLSVRSAELALDEARRRVAGRTLEYFFAALRAQRQGEIAQAAQREAEELLRIAKERFKLGKLAEIDLMEAQVSAETAQASVRTQQLAAANALDALKTYLGIPLEQGIRVTHDDRIGLLPSPLDEATLIAHALAHRADVQQMGLHIRRADLSVRQAEAEARPGVSLHAGYGRTGQGPTIGDSFSELRSESWSVGLSMTMSLTRKEDHAAIDRARRSLQLVEVEGRLLADEVRLEIRRLVRSVEEAAASAALLAETVKLAEENLRIRRVRFEHGLDRPVDVMETEDRLREARLRHADAVLNHQLAQAGLSLAIGEMPTLEGAES